MKKIIILFATVFVLLCLSAVASAETGWVKDGDYLYYYKNGSVQTGTQTVDGKVYTFAENGALKGNGKVQTTGYGKVYPGTDNKLQIAWQTVEGKKYYFSPSSATALIPDSEMRLGWKPLNIIDGISYLFDNDGVLVINDWWTNWSYVGPYFHSDSQGRVVYGYQHYGEYYYFFNDLGVCVNGFQNVDGTIHHFDENGKKEGEGYRESRGWKRIDKDWYYFNPSTGVMQTGKLDINGYHYMFDDDGKLVISKATFIILNDKLYALDTNGDYMLGWQTIDNNEYWFQTGSGNNGYAAAVTGAVWITDNDERNCYYFDKDGILQKDLFIKHPTYSESTTEAYYYYDSNGKRVSGWKTIDGKTYYFDVEYGAYIGVHSISDDGSWIYYYFNSEGVMQKDQLIKHNKDSWGTGEAYFYYGSDGIRVSGWKTIDGEKYYFDYTNGAYTGTHTINDVIYTFSDEGKLLETVIPVTGVELNKENLELKPGYSETLVATVIPDNATNKKVNWECDDTNIAKVDQNGKVTAVGAGDTRVRVWTEYEGYVAICDVYVPEVSQIEAFVTRCYKLILNREPDEVGLQGWCETLANKTATAAQIIDGFVSSAEYTNRNLSSGESVDILYNTMLNRAADEGGKAGWIDALGKGYTLQNIIDGFCGSPEFVGLCKDYGIEPGSVNAPAPADMSTPRGKIEAFVKRCYSLILSRDADQGGLQGWSDALESGAGQACQIIDGFVRSEEYTNRNLDAGASVDILYKTMLNREPDPDGRAGWVDALAQGYTLQHIINGFCGSAEFTAICNDYGITAGTLSIASALVKREAITPEGDEAEAPVVYQGYNSEFINEEKIRAFVEHCYVAVFGREGDTEGVENYTKLILNGKKMPKKVAYEFIFSPEFQNNLPGNEDFIRILYRLYFDREPGADELAGWVTMLENGASLEEIVNGFAGSAEFKAIVNAMKE